MAANSLTMNKDSKIEDLREDSVGITSSIIKSRNPRKNLKFSEEVVREGRGGLEVDSSSRGHTLLVHKEERLKCSSNYHRVMCSPVMPEPSAMLNHHAGHKFHEVFQLKQGRYADLPAANISEMMKSNSLDNAPTQSLLSVVNGILDESIDRKNGEIPHRVACLLRKVVQEIERRVSAQAEHIRTQSHMNKSREEKYQSRIRVLEALASGTNEEYQTHKSLMEERKKPQEEELVVKLMNDMENSDRETSTIKKDLLETARKKSEQKDAVVLMKDNSDTELEISAMKRELETTKNKYEQDLVRLKKEKGNSDIEISELKQELEITKKKHEQRCLQVETQAKETQKELQTRLKEFQLLLEESRKKEKELETFTALKARNWSKKEHTYQSSINFQFQALKELRLAGQYIKKEVINTQNNYLEEFNCLGEKFQEFAEAAQNYNMVLAENRRLHNEVQDLKGSIRVYCRIRPSPAGQSGKTSSIDYIGENGELTIVNPTKQGKDGHRVFKFNKVFGPLSTQAEVYLDTQPLIRSVLDGYNVCIFAYGQTGSGKTYTMSGPNLATKEEWGVNYRALNDLFDISWKRRSTISYEIGVQMVEIYNEQVRDLLSEGSQKKLEIRFTSQQNGLAVPGASMHPVRSTEHVLELMQIGLGNRAVSATAMNERSSRSHSVVTVHVQGTDLQTGSSLRGSLHLVDLAGSERIDRSEVTGDRLKEAQHINKSLSALGDVIFALAQKSAHVPYRNSKLTQVLQNSLGGQAKTLMFVQLNPRPDSYSETLSTLKFAERVSGVELGAARSNKEGKDVRELMEQVASLKDTITKKDEEIEHLQLLKDLRGTGSPASINREKRTGLSPLQNQSSSPRRNSLSAARGVSGGRGPGLGDKAASDQDNCSEYSDRNSEAGSHQSAEDISRQQLNDTDAEERMSDASDGGASVENEAEDLVGDLSISPADVLLADIDKSEEPSKVSQLIQKQEAKVNLLRSSSSSALARGVSSSSLSRVSSTKDSLKSPKSSKKLVPSSSSTKPLKGWQ